MSTLKWFCDSCKFPLAFVEDKKILRVKRKDLYVEVEGGKVTITCCRCGKRNTCQDDSNSETVDLKY